MKTDRVEGMRWDGSTESAMPIIDWVRDNGANIDYWDKDETGTWPYLEILRKGKRLALRPGMWLILDGTGDFRVYDSTYIDMFYRLTSGKTDEID